MRVKSQKSGYGAVDPSSFEGDAHIRTFEQRIPQPDRIALRMEPSQSRFDAGGGNEYTYHPAATAWRRRTRQKENGEQWHWKTFDARLRPCTHTSRVWETIFDVIGREASIAELEDRASAAGFWDDVDAAQVVLQRASREREALKPLLDLIKRSADLVEFCELAVDDAGGAELEGELAAEIAHLRGDLERFELETLLSGQWDARNAIVEINAGAGGTESCDWAQMLLRMYLRWAQEQGFETDVADAVAGDVAGFKSVTFEVRGRHAYGYLQAERGVHRLVRISPFDANKRRHTSFCSVDVIPETDEDDAIVINTEELRIDTYRSSGAGGQHVNKTDSAVRIVHIPTGIVVSCQNERSQHKNRAMAMKVLQSKLLERRRKEEQAQVDELRGEQQAIEWGNQIRSYVFQPYTLVKDHRTGCEVGDVMAVMDGRIDPFIRAYLQWKSAEPNRGERAKVRS